MPVNNFKAQIVTKNIEAQTPLAGLSRSFLRVTTYIEEKVENENLRLLHI